MAGIVTPIIQPVIGCFRLYLCNTCLCNMSRMDRACMSINHIEPCRTPFNILGKLITMSIVKYTEIGNVHIVSHVRPYTRIVIDKLHVPSVFFCKLSTCLCGLQDVDFHILIFARRNDNFPTKNFKSIGESTINKAKDIVPTYCIHHCEAMVFFLKFVFKEESFTDVRVAIAENDNLLFIVVAFVELIFCASIGHIIFRNFNERIVIKHVCRDKVQLDVVLYGERFPVCRFVNIDSGYCVQVSFLNRGFHKLPILDSQILVRLLQFADSLSRVILALSSEHHKLFFNVRVHIIMRPCTTSDKSRNSGLLRMESSAVQKDSINLFLETEIYPVYDSRVYQSTVRAEHKDRVFIEERIGVACIDVSESIPRMVLSGRSPFIHRFRVSLNHRRIDYMMFCRFNFGGCIKDICLEGQMPLGE